MTHMPAILIALTLGLSLTGCASPSPDMMGGVRHDTTVGGMNFVVFHKEAEAQVVRTGGYIPRKDRDRVPALMAQAAGQATGCAVIDNSMKTAMPGDTGVARFDLDCR